MRLLRLWRLERSTSLKGCLLGWRQLQWRINLRVISIICEGLADVQNYFDDVVVYGSTKLRWTINHLNRNGDRLV